jgi:hypothetical protein
VATASGLVQIVSRLPFDETVRHLQAVFAEGRDAADGGCSEPGD